MRGLSIWVCFALATVLTGCGKEQPPPNQGINITAPGVNVKADPTGAAINASGVKIDVSNK